MTRVTANVESFPLEKRVQLYTFPELHVVSKESPIHTPIVQQGIEKVDLVWPERENGRQVCSTVMHQAPTEVFRLDTCGNGRSMKRRYELRAKVFRVECDMVDGDMSPILPVHPAVGDKGDPQ